MVGQGEVEVVGRPSDHFDVAEQREKGSEGKKIGGSGDPRPHLVRLASRSRAFAYTLLVKDASEVGSLDTFSRIILARFYFYVLKYFGILENGRGKEREMTRAE